MTDTAIDLALYVPPEKPWMLRLNSDESFRDQLQDVVRLWRAHAEARGDRAEAINLSYVVRRMLEAGIAQAFEEYGGRPTTEDGWKAVLGAVKSTTKDHASKKR
jgi:hypothetical protein